MSSREKTAEGKRVEVRTARQWIAMSAVPFALGIGFLLAHKKGWVEEVPGLTYEATLSLNLVLYWLLLAMIVVLVTCRRRLTRWLLRQWPQVLLLCMSLVVSLVVLEVVLRTLRPDLAALPFERWPSSTLHHRNAPNRSSLGMGDQRVRTNADGLRSPYSRETFVGHGQRIVLLGDSYTFGLGVAEEEGVAAVLERQLADAEADVAVLNTGVISYSPYLERLAFEHVVADYQPTLTLLLLDINDIGDDHQYRRENRSTDPAQPFFEVPAVVENDGLCTRLAACRALEPLWDRLRKPKQVMAKMRGAAAESYDYYDFSVDVLGVTEHNRFFVLRHPLSSTRPYFEATLANIEAVAQAVRATGSEFILVVMPRYFHWDDSEAPDNWESDRYGVDEPFENVYLEFFDQAATHADFPVWSLLSAFEHADSGPLVFAHDPHWNAQGHRVAGEALAEWLLDAGWPGSVAGAPARYSFGSRPAEGK